MLKPHLKIMLPYQTSMQNKLKIAYVCYLITDSLNGCHYKLCVKTAENFLSITVPALCFDHWSEC